MKHALRRTFEPKLVRTCSPSYRKAIHNINIHPHLRTASRYVQVILGFESRKAIPVVYFGRSAAPIPSNFVVALY